MASDDEDEELAALRFAALASMKTKKNPFEEDPDLKALKESALRTLENTTFTPSVPPGIPSYIPGSLPHPAQSYSPNYYSNQPLPPAQYQYTQPPPAFRGNSNYYLYPQQQQQQQQRNFDQHSCHRQAFNIQQQYKSRPGRGLSGPGSTSSRRGGTPGSRGGTPPTNTTAAPQGSSSRGPGQHGNPPPGAPPRANNLIVINPLAPHGATADQGGDVGRGSGSTATSAPLLLRPQDKWSGTSDSTSQTASPSRPKATGKFSRFESSGSETEESESEEETTPMNKSTEKVDSDSTDAKSEEEKEETKESKSSDSDNDSDSVVSEVEMDTGDNDNSKDVVTDIVDKHDWSESESAMSSDDGVEVKDVNEDEKTGSDENRESETEEEKRERKETDRLLEESIDPRHVHDTSSEMEESHVPKWTTQNMQEMAPTVDVSRNSFDLSHKLTHRRAMMKDQIADKTAVCDLSEKLKNRKSRPPNVADTVAPVSSVPKDSVNVRISETVPDPDKAERTTMSEADLKRFEARKRKFETSPLSTGSRKTTISLKGIVPRPKKRSKERSKSQSPIPKRYSRDLKRFEKKRILRKSTSKESKELKSTHNGPRGKEKSEWKAKHKVISRRKSMDTKKAKSEADLSDASKSDASAQISDDSDEEGGRAWKKEGNKSKIVFNKDKARPIRDSLEPVRFDSHPRRNVHDRFPSQSDRYGARRPRFGERPDSRLGRDRLGDERWKNRRGAGGGVGGRRSVKVMEESDSDSDGPRLLSSVVLPGGRPQSDKRRGDGFDEESTSSHDSSLGHSHGAKKRMVVSTVKENPKRGSRKVTAEFDSQRTSSIRPKSENGNHSKRKDKNALHDLSALSVTVDSDVPPGRSRESVHRRLGRQLTKPDSREDEKTQSKGKLSDERSSSVVDESAQGDSTLEQRIQRIKEKNAAILKRREEVRQDKERYG